jgi:hypothetical protein
VSSENIYNGAIVTGATPDGRPVLDERTSSQLSGVALEVPSSPAPTNPGFDVGTTGWTATTSAITRDTGVFDTPPASGRWDNTGASDALGVNDVLTAAFTGTFQRGVFYRAQVNLQTFTADGDVFLAFGDVAAGDFTNLDQDDFKLHLGDGWRTLTIDWTPAADRTAVTLRITNAASGGNFFRVDRLAVLVALPTIVDRRGFRRRQVLQAQNAVPPDYVAANVLADAWLANHRATPYKGQRTLTGPGACRDLLTGANVPPERLLLRTTELLRMSDAIDPDTGALGRDARIAAVTYDLASDTATVSLDNTDSNFEAFLARAALLSGSPTSSSGTGIGSAGGGRS